MKSAAEISNTTTNPKPIVFASDTSRYFFEGSNTFLDISSSSVPGFPYVPPAVLSSSLIRTQEIAQNRLLRLGNSRFEASFYQFPLSSEPQHSEPPFFEWWNKTRIPQLKLHCVRYSGFAFQSMPTEVVTPSFNISLADTSYEITFAKTECIYIGEPSLPGIASPWLQSLTRQYSEAEFERLAQEEPSELLQILKTGVLLPADLTFAAEAAGRIPDSDRVKKALLPLLKHPSAVVREGAIYGLARHLDKQIATALEKLAYEDDSPGVREAALELISDQ